MPLGVSDLYGFNVVSEETCDSAWRLTVATTTPNEEVRLSISGGIIDLHIDWGDGNSNDYVAGATIGHIYDIAGSYTVSFSGDVGTLNFYIPGVPYRMKWKAIQNRVSRLPAL